MDDSVLCNRNHIEITGSFIRQHWNTLYKQSIELFVTSLDFVHLFRELVSLSSSLLLTSGLNTDSSISGNVKHEHDPSWFGITISPQLTIDDLNKLLTQMENASLLIPSSSPHPLSSSPPTSSPSLPTISIECVLLYPKDYVELVTLLARDMTDHVKSRHYTNLLSFTVRTDVCYS
jgi:hypothetical protein